MLKNALKVEKHRKLKIKFSFLIVYLLHETFIYLEYIVLKHLQINAL